MAEKSKAAEKPVEAKVPFTDNRNPEATQRELIGGMRLAIADETIEQIKLRGRYAERQGDLLEVSDAGLAEALSKIADYGSLADSVVKVLRAAAGRLASSDNGPDRDLWRNHVEGKHWYLVEYVSFGNCARYSVHYRDPALDYKDEQFQTLMITHAGNLMERQVAVNSGVAQDCFRAIEDQVHQAHLARRNLF